MSVTFRNCQTRCNVTYAPSLASDLQQISHEYVPTKSKEETEFHCDVSVFV